MRRAEGCAPRPPVRPLPSAPALPARFSMVAFEGRNAWLLVLRSSDGALGLPPLELAPLDERAREESRTSAAAPPLAMAADGPLGESLCEVEHGLTVVEA